MRGFVALFDPGLRLLALEGDERDALGSHVEPVLGQPLDKILRAPARAEWEARLGRALQGEESAFEWTAPAGGNRIFVRVVPLHGGDDSVQGALATGIDTETATPPRGRARAACDPAGSHRQPPRDCGDGVRPGPARRACLRRGAGAERLDERGDAGQVRARPPSRHPRRAPGAVVPGGVGRRAFLRRGPVALRRSDPADLHRPGPGGRQGRRGGDQRRHHRAQAGRGRQPAPGGDRRAIQ